MGGFGRSMQRYGTLGAYEVAGMRAQLAERADGKEELVNEAAGHLLRVKLQGVDEGGVCAGFAVLSSPVMC